MFPCPLGQVCALEAEIRLVVDARLSPRARSANTISISSPNGENQKSLEDIKIKNRKVRFLGGLVAGDRKSSGQ